MQFAFAIIIFLLGTTALANGNVYGCKEWCEARFLPRNGRQATQSEWKNYENCINQTQYEEAQGRSCGGAAKAPSRNSAGKRRVVENNDNQQEISEGSIMQGGQEVSGGNGPNQASPAGNPNNAPASSVSSGEAENQPSPQELAGCRDYLSELARCEKASADAVKSCDEESNNDLKKFTTYAEQNISKLGQMQQMAQNMGAIAGSCSAALSTVKAAFGAFNNFQLQCQDKQKVCLDACGLDTNRVTQCVALVKKVDPSAQVVSPIVYENAKAKCENIKSTLTQSGNYIADLQQAIGQIQMCKAFNSASQALIPQTCFTNPNTPECQAAMASGDCNSPALAGSPTCACRNGLNTPQCQAALAGSQKISTGGGRTDLGSTAATERLLKGAEGGGGDMIDFSSSDLAMEYVPPGDTGPGEDLGGQRGGGAGIDGSSTGGDGYGPVGSNGGSAGGGINTNISSGYSGGGGGMGWGGDSYGSGGSGGSGYARGTSGNSRGLPNLAKYRPNMPYKNAKRNLAGVVGPDGVLGPHANMWATVKNRYQYEWRQGQLTP